MSLSSMNLGRKTQNNGQGDPFSPEKVTPNSNIASFLCVMQCHEGFTRLIINLYMLIGYRLFIEVVNLVR